MRGIKSKSTDVLFKSAVFIFWKTQVYHALAVHLQPPQDRPRR